MTSLLDIAKAMDKEKQDSKLKVEKAGPTKPALSLVDIAKEQQAAVKQASAKPSSLVDVARKADSEGKVVNVATKPLSLQNLADEINQEERSRLDVAISKAATEVKTEKVEQRNNALKEATTEVLQENAQEVAASSPTETTTQHVASSSTDSNSPLPLRQTENDDDGYSSFGDEEVEIKKTEKSSTSRSAKNPRAKYQRTRDSQCEAESDSGPEKTTPSDSLQAKEFLRAIYRGDARRVRDMMRDVEMDASTADQHGWSALHWAASQDQTEILATLLKKTAGVNAVEHVNGWTALHLAVVRNAVHCVKQLLQAGAQVTIQDLYGDTVYDLLRAVKGKKKERLLQLLEFHRLH